MMIESANTIQKECCNRILLLQLQQDILSGQQGEDLGVFGNHAIGNRNAIDIALPSPLRDLSCTYSTIRRDHLPLEIDSCCSPWPLLEVRCLD